jgi:hypothetical protein
MKLHSISRRTRSWLAWAGAAALPLAATACTTVSTGATGAPTAATHITIGLASEGLSAAFPVGIANGVKQVAASHGAKAIVLDGKLSETTQESDIQEMDRITAASGGVATRRDSWAEPAVAASAPYYPQFEQAHTGTRALPRDPRWPRISLILNQMVGQVVTGGGTPDKLLAAAQEDLAALD